MKIFNKKIYTEKEKEIINLYNRFQDYPRNGTCISNNIDCDDCEFFNLYSYLNNNNYLEDKLFEKCNRKMKKYILEYNKGINYTAWFLL